MIKILIVVLVLGLSSEYDCYQVPTRFQTGSSSSSYCTNMIPVCRKDLSNNDDGVCNCYHKKEKNSLCCDFKNKNGTLSSKDIQHYTSLDIANADAFSYWCSRNIHQTLKLQDVKKSAINNQRGEREYNCQLSYVTNNSSIDHLVSAVSIKLNESTVSKISDSDRLANLELKKTIIKKLSSVTIVGNDVNKETYCAELHSSTIIEMKDITVDCSFFSDGLTVYSTLNSTITRSKIENTIFKDVGTFGLRLVEQRHMLHHVLFVKLVKHALIIDSDFNANFVHVEIQHCEEPCILVLNGGIVAKDLVIEHNLIDSSKSSKYIAKSDKSVRTFVDLKLCKTEDSNHTLECDLASYNAMRLEYLSSETMEQPVKLMNHYAIAVYMDCQSTLQLYRITGYVYYYENPTDDCRNIDSSLSVNHSILSHIKLNKLSVLNVSNSDVSSLFIKEVMDLSIEKSTVNSIFDLTHKVVADNTNKKSYFKISSTEIESIYNTTLLNMAHMQDLKINGSIYELTIKHSWGDETVIKNTHIEKIHQRGLVIEEGTVVLDNVYIAKLMPRGIILGDEAFLHFEKNCPPIYCLNQPGILAPMRSRVIIKDRKTEQWLRQCVAVTEDDSDDSKDDDRHNMVPKDCRISEYRVANCSMKNQKKAVAIGFNNKMDDVITMNVSDAFELQIGNHCFDKIIIMSVSSVKYYEKEYCYHALTAENSTIYEVGDRIVDLLLKKCKVYSIKDKIDDAYIVNSHLGTFEVTVANLAIRDSTLAHMKKLQLYYNGSIDNTLIDLIGNKGIFVEDFATLSFVNTVINKMETEAIVVAGSLLMKNVTIKRSKKIAFIRKEFSRVNLIDVTFEESVPNVFGKENGQEIELTNVKMNGEKYTKNDIFRNDEINDVTNGDHDNEDSPNYDPIPGIFDPKEETKSQEQGEASDYYAWLWGSITVVGLCLCIILVLCCFRHGMNRGGPANRNAAEGFPLHDMMPATVPDNPGSQAQAEAPNPNPNENEMGSEEQSVL